MIQKKNFKLLKSISDNIIFSGASSASSLIK